MNQITPTPKIEIIPSSAPFSEAQRSWLNGFFAGLLSDAPTPLSAEQGAAVMQGAGDGDDGEAPWHDQTMPIADRMKLAEGRPLRPGAINGGFFPRKPDWPAQHPSVVVAVDDLDASIAKVKGAGGSVLGEPMDIPGVGRYVSFEDTERNRVGMLQPLPRGDAKSD